MANQNTGFFVPESISATYTGPKASPAYSYVASKRDEGGQFMYDAAGQEVGLQKQAALQNLGKTYADTIENAYASYLASNRKIGTSAMGQGYKEAYQEAQDKALAANIAATNQSVSSVRQELNQQEVAAKEAISDQFSDEVAYFNKAAQSMDDYLVYVKSLTGTADQPSYLTEEQQKYSTAELYETLLSAQPDTFRDETGAGKSYVDWLRNTLGTTTADTEFFDWMYGSRGGYDEFRTAAIDTSRTKLSERREREETIYNTEKADLEARTREALVIQPKPDAEKDLDVYREVLAKAEKVKESGAKYYGNASDGYQRYNKALGTYQQGFKINDKNYKMINGNKMTKVNDKNLIKRLTLSEGDVIERNGKLSIVWEGYLYELELTTESGSKPTTNSGGGGSRW